MAVDMVSNLSTKVGSYVQWAENVSSGKSVAGLTRTDDTDRVQNFKDIPRGAQSAAKQAALDDFKRALTDAVGESILDQAWKDTKAAKQKSLSASMIMKLVTRANELLQKSMTHPNGVMKRLFNLSTEQIRTTVNGDRPPPETFKHQCKVSIAVMRSNALLGMTPITHQQAEEFQNRFNQVNNELAKCWDELQQRKDTQSTQLAGQIMGIMEKLAQKMSEVGRSSSKLPGSKASLKKLAEHWTAALNHACQTTMDALSKTQTPSTVNNLQKQLNKLQADLSQDGAMMDLLKKNRKEIGKKLQSMFNDSIKAALGKSGPKQMVNGVKLGSMIAKAHGDILNKAEWAPISKTFTGTLNGQSFELQSDIVSGGRICKSIASQYEDGVNAYNSHSMGTSNAVNLATSKLTVTGPDKKSRTIFSGVRHGVHSAQDIASKTERGRANAERARQTVMAAFTSYLEAHPDKMKNKDWEGKVISFNMTSVSLLTATSIKSNEESMLADQKAAWDEINNTPLEVKVGDKTYTVCPNIITFNYGVDHFAVETILDIGWRASDPINKQGLAAMRNRVHTYLADPNVSPTDRKTVAVQTLWRQIQEITEKRGERSANGEAYKVPARLAVLSYLMGDVPVWNCKSGKDRTGMLDVEAKFLATLIDRGEEIPEPGAKLTLEQSQLLKTIAMESGNIEMQEYNTGIGGYKLYGGKPTFERLGGQGSDGKVEQAIRGGSGYVGS